MDSSVKTLETQMKEAFEKEGLQRKQEYENLEEKMVLQMEEGPKKEQQARQQVHSKKAQWFKNEEHSRQRPHSLQ